MPMPSGGCQTCRARHIKCDETRPTCLNCQKSGRDCAGWRTGTGSLLFLSENIYASTEIRRPKGGARWVPEFSADDFSEGGRRNAKSAKKPSPGVEPRRPLDAAESSQAGSSGIVTSVPNSLQQPLKDLAFNHFARIYFRGDTLTPESLWTIIGNFFVTSHTSLSEEGSLKLSLSALSLAHYARNCRVPAAMLQAQMKYSLALQRIRTETGSQNSALADELLISIMVMAAYENNTCSCDSEKLSAHEFQHHKGAIALLKLRRDCGTVKCGPNSIDRCIRRQVMKSCIYRAEPVPDWLQNGVEFGEEEHQAGLDQGVTRLASLRNRAIYALETSRSGTYIDPIAIGTEIEMLISDALSILDDLATWRANLDPEYEFTMVHGSLDQSPASLSSLFYSSKIHTFEDMNVAAMWGRYRGARLFVNCLLTKLVYFWRTMIDLDPNRYAPVERRIHLDTQMTAEEVCAGVPFAFDVDFNTLDELPTVIQNASPSRVYSLVWPFVSIAGTPLIDEQLREWVREKLHFISRVTGNGILQKVANMNLQNHALYRRENLLHFNCSRKSAPWFRKGHVS